jgi:hypothetical protein
VAARGTESESASIEAGGRGGAETAACQAIKKPTATSVIGIMQALRGELDGFRPQNLCRRDEWAMNWEHAGLNLRHLQQADR